MQAQTTAVRTMTDLTCWKCGEESLKEVTDAGDSFSPKGERIAATGIWHSDCQKCGAYSVNPAQLRHNQVVAKSNRKAIIKEANRKSG